MTIRHTPSASYFDSTGRDDVLGGGTHLIPSRRRRAPSASGPSASATPRRGGCSCCTAGRVVHVRVLRAFDGWLPAEGIEFIYYDQLGSAYSDQPKDESLWTTERFVEEVEQVRVALGLNKDNFFLLGHSWGGILATEYALKYPQHLKGLIISNMVMSIPDYNRYASEVLAKGMDPAVVKEIKALEAKGAYESPRYMELLTPNFYAKHVCRLPEWPDPVNRGFGKLNKQVYVLMQGPSEFGASGRLERWDRKADLPKLAMPTLSIGATHDTMDPAHMKWIASQVQHGSFLLCPNGSHMAMWDDQATYAQGLITFLKAVDAGRFEDKRC